MASSGDKCSIHLFINMPASVYTSDASVLLQPASIYTSACSHIIQMIQITVTVPVSRTTARTCFWGTGCRKMKTAIVLALLWAAMTGLFSPPQSWLWGYSAFVLFSPNSQRFYDFWKIFSRPTDKWQHRCLCDLPPPTSPPFLRRGIPIDQLCFGTLTETLPCPTIWRTSSTGIAGRLEAKRNQLPFRRCSAGFLLQRQGKGGTPRWLKPKI